LSRPQRLLASAHFSSLALPFKGRVGWGWCCSTFQVPSNRFKHSLDVLEYFVVPVAQDREAARFERKGSSGIAIACTAVLATIKFDYDAPLEASEVEDEIAVRMLATKLAPLDLSAAKALPEPMLCLGWRIPQSPLQLRFQNALVRLTSHSSP